MSPTQKHTGNHSALPLRRIAREIALQYLFQLDMCRTAGQKPLDRVFWEQMTEERPELGDKEWRKVRPQSQFLIDGVSEHLADLDDTVVTAAENWRIDRMALVDRNILRLAAYEILHRSDVPAPVCINEAIEIAKLYGGDESSRFINGILDRIRRNQEP